MGVIVAAVRMAVAAAAALREVLRVARAVAVIVRHIPRCARPRGGVLVGV